jgi:hypothetical protein
MGVVAHATKSPIDTAFSMNEISLSVNGMLFFSIKSCTDWFPLRELQLKQAGAMLWSRELPPSDNATMWSHDSAGRSQ